MLTFLMSSVIIRKTHQFHWLRASTMAAASTLEGDMANLMAAQRIVQNQISNITRQFESALEVERGIDLEEYALSLSQSRSRVKKVSEILTNLQFKLERLE